jgi:hypothetical protein
VISLGTRSNDLLAASYNIWFLKATLLLLQVKFKCFVNTVGSDVLNGFNGGAKVTAADIEAKVKYRD